MIPREIIRKVKRLEIATRGLVNQLFSGEYHSVFKGRGMTFSEVREYQYGDDLRSIDWNVTARMGTPFVKIFEEDRELTLLLVVDFSGSENFGSTTRLKREVVAELGAVLAFSALKNNDKVGLLIFAGETEKFIPPQKGRSHVLRILQEILYYQPRNKKTNIAQALEFTHKILKKRSIIFVMSDFIDSGFESGFQLLRKKHDVIAANIYDRRERTIPPSGLIKFRDPESGSVILVDTSSRAVQKLFPASTNAYAQEMKDFFKRNKIDLIDIPADESYIDPVVSFFRKRTRKR